MKSGKKIILALILLFFGLALFSEATDRTDRYEQTLNCYTVLVGKKASADGSVLVAHNEDDYGDILVNVRKIAPRNYGPTVKINLGHGAVYETDGRTNGFLWIEATTQEFADSFINEYGVVITSDACSSKENKEDLTDGGIGYMLRRIVAEKAKSAREAVKLAGELVEKYGYRSSGRTYSIADKNEAWVVAVIRGRHWFAQRVPDDEVAVIPNFYTIRQVCLDDPDNFMGSSDIIEYAKNNGWYDEAKDGPFDFKKAFARPSSREPVFDGNTLRMWRGLTILSGKEWEINGDYPFSFKPAKKVTPEMLMALLRDHYEGTQYDATAGYKEGSPNRTRYRTICTSSTINSFVACLNDKKPEPLSVLVWLAFGKPDTTIYLPVFYQADPLPECFGSGPTTHDYELFYRQHFVPTEMEKAKEKLLNYRVKKMEARVEENYGQLITTLQKELFPLEASFLKEVNKLMAGRDKALKEKTTALLKEAVNKTNQAYDRLEKSTAGK